MSLEVAKLTKKIMLNTNVIECEFECNVAVIAHPGQYILIEAEGQWRPFSVAETPGENVLVLVIQLVAGTLSERFFNSLEIGDEVKLQEPRGTLVLPDSNHLVLAATGTGIVPLYTIASHLLTNDYKHEITIIFGVRTEDKLFYQHKLQQLAEAYPNCHVVITVSRPSREWTGTQGRVSDYIYDHVDQLKDREFYLCGRKETVASLVQMLEESDIPSSKINFIE